MPNSKAKDELLALLRREIRDERVLRAFESVEREQFVPPELASRAYENAPLPIGEDQTISQPLMIAIMLQALDVSEGCRALEVGTGSGYQAALLAAMGARVVSVELLPKLAAQAKRRLADLGYGSVEVHEAVAGKLGWAEDAPYDRIVVAAAAPSVPQGLFEQLAPDGVLVIPVGSPFEQNLAKVSLHDGVRQVQWKGPCRFVPLMGDDGWEPDPGVRA